MSKNEIVSLIETMNNYDELASKAKAKADAIRDALKEEMLRLDTEELNAFMEQNRTWLPDYALYMAVKRHFGMRAWTEWVDEDIRLHRPVAVEKYRRELWEDVRLFTYIQYLFFAQWEALRPEKGHRHHRRPAYLCGHGFRRCVERSPELPAGREECAHRRGGGSARLFQRGRTAVGQSPVQLAGHGGGRLRLVDPPGGRRVKAV